MLKLIEGIGADVSFKRNTSNINPEKIVKTTINDEAGLIRGSVLLTGPLMAKFGKIKIPLPGGCKLGERKIDFHIEGLKKMGAKVKLNNNYICLKSDGLKGNDIVLPFPSVGATENIMIAATLAEGTTLIDNCAQEPEIIDLGNFLIKMGAKIKGLGTSKIAVEGVEDLNGCEHCIIPDRIETGTYIAAAAITNSEITIKNCEPSTLENFIEKIVQMGIKIKRTKIQLKVSGEENLSPLNIITEPYPGFPTDIHPLITPVLSLANGQSCLHETIYESRFKYVNELKKMGSNIQIDGNKLIINGPSKLKGCKVNSPDLRGGTALIIASLAAKGNSIVTNIDHVDKGYEKIEEKLRGIGAKIKRI